MTTVLLFVEHEMNSAEMAMTLEAMADLRDGKEDPVDVTVLVPYATRWPTTLADGVVAVHGISAANASGDSRHDAAAATARRTLRHVLSAVRGGGHHAVGELVAISEVSRDVSAEVVARGVQTVLVASSPHRIAHAFHRDLERRLRRAGIAHVIRLPAADGAAGA
jgi:hypothetical protein